MYNRFHVNCYLKATCNTILSQKPQDKKNESLFLYLSRHRKEKKEKREGAEKSFNKRSVNGVLRYCNNQS